MPARCSQRNHEPEHRTRREIGSSVRGTSLAVIRPWSLAT
jgi:hypothetical protein